MTATIDKHISHILKKLGYATRLEMMGDYLNQLSEYYAQELEHNAANYPLYRSGFGTFSRLPGELDECESTGDGEALDSDRDDQPRDGRLSDAAIAMPVGAR